VSAATDAILADRCIAVVRAAGVPDPVGLTEVLAAAGIRAVELTFTIPDVLAHITRAAAVDGAFVGAGTVTNGHDAQAAIDAGATFLVTPGVSEPVALVAAARDVPLIMGALTATEVMRARDLGAWAIKIFPSGAVGPAYIRHLLGPFPDARLVASGGIGESDAHTYLAAGAVCVAAGSSVVSGEAVRHGHTTEIGQRARAFVAALG